MHNNYGKMDALQGSTRKEFASSLKLFITIWSQLLPRGPSWKQGCPSAPSALPSGRPGSFSYSCDSAAPCSLHSWVTRGCENSSMAGGFGSTERLTLLMWLLVRKGPISSLLASTCCRFKAKLLPKAPRVGPWKELCTKHQEIQVHTQVVPCSLALSLVWKEWVNRFNFCKCNEMMSSLDHKSYF